MRGWGAFILALPNGSALNPSLVDESRQYMGNVLELRYNHNSELNSWSIIWEQSHDYARYIVESSSRQAPIVSHVVDQLSCTAHGPTALGPVVEMQLRRNFLRAHMFHCLFHHVLLMAGHRKSEHRAKSRTPGRLSDNRRCSASL